MKHCFRNSDGEVVAADSAEQASRYHDVELGGGELDEADWTQVPDDELIPVLIKDDNPKEKDEVVRKPASEWAAMHNTPALVATSYV